ncbi:efflux pump antibiotic resistance protein, putative [Talaromyces stipitatus ATCC 10500]|uniref:Efflux pump antibiotic resistance protein, putative n=1 Tax=Talaromyces stipitatus (strain ATCC 10500 / CBS 375.48 / QM 6759 / NRRL 1006) TaxID=441959 RepID=B8MAD5_TALSN|nr:efflux pump antibiotic resistance protein, putative [Talaromyces stipitatus ATCC 10500]EED18637.1 efflux pump antibiotic resistance protein, putative [Talaromyces stipitatus ATCC 10500]
MEKIRVPDQVPEPTVPNEEPSSSQQHDEPTKQRQYLYGWRLYLLQSSLYLGLILSIMDSSAVSTALVTIGDHFNDFMHIQKWATIAALAFITAFSIGCGCAQTIQQLIAFRALQGIGGAGGPVVGGIITTHSTWRWVFWFNIPISGTILLLLLLLCPNIKYQGRITWKQFDLFGCLIYLASCTLLITALQEGGSGSMNWNSAAFIACMILAGVIFASFALWIAYLSKGKHSTIPLFPARIVTHRIMLSTILVSTCVGFVFYSILIQLPERFQIMAGVSLLALSGPSAFGSFIGGTASVKRNNTFYTLLAGCSFIMLGTGIMHTINSGHSIPVKIYGLEVLMCFGFKMIFSTTIVLIKLHADQRDSASAQGLMSQARLLGGNISLAIATIVLNQNLISDLRGVVPADEIDSLRHSLLAMTLLTPEQAETVRRPFANAFVTQLDINMGITGLALICVLGTWQRHPTTFKEKIEEAENQNGEEDTESRGVNSGENSNQV